MTLMVFDEDVDEHDIIGGAVIPFKKLLAENGMDEWVTIKHKGKSAGLVHVKARDQTVERLQIPVNANRSTNTR